MNAIKYALARASFDIPEEIILNAYDKRSGFGLKPESIESIMEREVIRKRVMADLDVKHGMTMWVDLATVGVTVTDDAFSFIYDIPNKLLDGRRLISVLSIHFMDHFRLLSYGNPGVNNMSALNRVSRAIVDSNTNIPTYDTKSMEVIGDNTVLVRYGQIPQANMFMICNVTNDADLNNFHPGIFPVFAELCTEAIKADIYRRVSIRMDRSEMINGVSIGKFREIIDGYADAGKNYADILKRMVRALRMNDLPTKQTLIGYAMGRARR